MQDSPALRVLRSSKWTGFLLGGRRTPTVWLQGSQSRGLGGQAHGEGSLKTQLRVRVMALGNGSSDLPVLMQAPLGVELREYIQMCSRIGVSGQGDH